MELPEIITRLPEAVLPVPRSVALSNCMKTDQGLLIFFQFLVDFVVPPHSHRGGQWGTVIDGQAEVTVDGKARTYRQGESYFIPGGAVHGVTLQAGAKLIEFFEESDRYTLKS